MRPMGCAWPIPTADEMGFHAEVSKLETAPREPMQQLRGDLP